MMLRVGVGAEGVIRLHDTQPSHVHPPGRPITLSVEVAVEGVSKATIYAQWVDEKSLPVGDAIEIPAGKSVVLHSPGVEIGYWGLYFFSKDKQIAFPPQTPGWPSQEYGFAILSPRTFAEGRLEPDSFFGMVHPNIGADPYLVGGAKTLTWNTVKTDRWGERIRRVRAANLVELPLVNGKPWQSDDTKPIAAAQLAAIEKKFHAYLRADQSVDVWELGIEENLGSKYNQPYYFENLSAKVKRMRKVADTIGRPVQFAIQFVNFKDEKIRQLIESGVLQQFQILSLHPYRWPDFPAPEAWFPREIKKLRKLLVAAGYSGLELWITEIGLPVRGNRDPQGFFGYPKRGKAVPGVSRDYAAGYLVKCHAFAALENIHRVYVYNYQDRGKDITRAEDHFGLRSYTGDKSVLGFPKQAYVAYVRMLQELEGQKFVDMQMPRPHTYVFNYRSEKGGGRLLAWINPEEAPERFDWNDLISGQPGFDVRQVRDLYGRVQKDWDSTGITLTDTPVYIEYLSKPHEK
jgi:hypothetical protein